MHENQTGVLVIAHGSNNVEWEKSIEHAVCQVDIPLPIEIGYLEFNDHKTIEKSVRRLEQTGVGVIIAIPLFISSGSTHIDEIKYALQIQKQPKSDTDIVPVSTSCAIVWRQPMDDHPLMAELMIERLESLSVSAENETLLLVAHGSDHSPFRDTWEAFLDRMVAAAADRFSFRETGYGTLHPDTLRQKAERLSRQGNLIVLPIFLCEGYFTKKVIPAKLEGLPHRGPGDTYLPHMNVARWIGRQVESALYTRLPQQH